jgi:hypothetical protein
VRGKIECRRCRTVADAGGRLRGNTFEMPQGWWGVLPPDEWDEFELCAACGASFNAWVLSPQRSTDPTGWHTRIRRVLFGLRVGTSTHSRWRGVWLLAEGQNSWRIWAPSKVLWKSRIVHKNSQDERVEER